MNTERIKEIQQQTPYPESVSVQQALLQVWNECEQEQLRIGAVVGRSEQLVCPYCKGKNIEIRHREQSFRCVDCKEGWAN